MTINRVNLTQDEGCDDHPPALRLIERELSDSQAGHIANLKEQCKANLTATPGVWLTLFLLPSIRANIVPQQNLLTVYLRSGKTS